MDDANLTTAHRSWNERWATPEGREGWLEPEADVIAAVERLPNHTRPQVLDLGCGVGRHTLYLAAQGFEVWAMDASANGLDVIREEAEKHALSVHLAQGPMTELPYADGQFDYVLAWNVIYHGDGQIVRRCMEEIHRVLRPNGIYQGTMLSKRHKMYGQGREIAPNTFVAEGHGDKNHPHYYCNAAELVDLVRPFEIVSLVDRDQRDDGSLHWHLVAERAP